MFFKTRRKLKKLQAEVNGLKSTIQAFEKTISHQFTHLGIDDRKLETSIRVMETSVRAIEEHIHWTDKLFFKAFSLTGLHGQYVEFGVYQGSSLAAAYWTARRIADNWENGALSHSDADGSIAKRLLADFATMKFIGFDSFEGIPESKISPEENEIFSEGSYAAGKNLVMSNLAAANVPMGQVQLVKGWFNDSCTPETAKSIGLESIAVAHIDSDLYESAITALNFCTPYFRPGSVVIFDEWFQFRGSPEHGEQRALREWLSANPGWRATEFGREGLGRMAFVLNKKV